MGESEAESMMRYVKVFMPPGDMVVVLYLAIVYIDPLVAFFSLSRSINEALFNTLSYLMVQWFHPRSVTHTLAYSPMRNLRSPCTSIPSSTRV
jgi:hypothetical protein